MVNRRLTAGAGGALVAGLLLASAGLRPGSAGALDAPAPGVIEPVAVFAAPQAEAVSACQDGADNDGDGLLDTSDPGCDSALDPGERSALLPATTRGTTTATDSQTSPPIPDAPPRTIRVSARAPRATMAWTATATASPITRRTPDAPA
jgi:hypothetical protein